MAPFTPTRGMQRMAQRIRLFLPLALALGGGHALAAASQVAMEHVVLHRDDSMYYLGPSLAVLANGEILMGLREAHARPPGSGGHVDPTARGILLRSRDGGRTFGEKTVIDDETHRFSSSQDTTLTALPDGSLLASVYSWGIAPVPTGIALTKIHSGQRIVGPEKPFISIFEGLWTRRSVDGGLTWTARRPIDLPGLPPLAARSPVVVLNDGTLLMQANDVSRGVGERRDWARVFCLRSTDRGETWREAVLAAEGSKIQTHFLEPSLTRLKSGRLLSLLRTRGEGEAADERRGKVQTHFGFLFQTHSDDDGRTWSAPAQTPMWGFPAHVLELKDGRLFCAYGYRREPFGVRATMSRDGGRTWDIANEIILRADGGGSDLGYPVSVQLADGRIFVAYYFALKKEGNAKAGAQFLAGTYLTLP